MPYIEQARRDAIITNGEIPATAGELNYVLTMVTQTYLRSKGLSYSTINDILGAFDGAKAEFYRRVAAPYEDEKIETNGDVY